VSCGGGGFMRARWFHLSDFRQGQMVQPVFERRLARVAAGAVFRWKQHPAKLGGREQEVGREMPRLGQILQKDQKIGQLLRRERLPPKPALRAGVRRGDAMIPHLLDERRGPRPAIPIGPLAARLPRLIW
jgi:hypothetical protein